MNKPTRNFQCYHEDQVCYVKDACRYWVRDLEIGNCVLRIESPMSQPEIARALGVTKQAVIQTEQRALRKIYQIWARHYNGVPLQIITKTVRRSKRIDCGA